MCVRPCAVYVSNLVQNRMCIEPCACVYIGPGVGGVSDLVQAGVYQTWCRVCIRPGAGCVSELVQGVYQTWLRVCIRPDTGCVSDLVQGVYQTRCRGSIRPGARCVSDLVKSVQLRIKTWRRACYQLIQVVC